MKADDPFDAIDRLGTLRDGWDSYGAAPIEQASREQAKRCLSEVQRLLGVTYARPVVGPTPEAGVALVWRSSRGGELDALFSSRGARFVVLGPKRLVVHQGPITDYQEFAREVVKRFVA